MKKLIRQKNSEGGYAIAALLIFLVIATAVMAGWMKLSVASTRTVHANKVRNTGYAQAEGSLNAALSWLRHNSAHMTPLFSMDNFCSKFDRYSNASLSTNDPATGNFPVATRIKVKGTNDSPLLIQCTGANCNGLGTPSFPNSFFSGTVTAFNTAGQFGSVDVGQNIVKVTLVDAAPEDESVNHVCSAGPVKTNFFPVYRIDAMTGNDSGSRVFGYVSGSLKYSEAVGFYGKDRVGIGKPCASDHFTGSTPDSSVAGPNQGMFHAMCNVGSEGPVTFTNNWKSKVYGSVTSTCATCAVDTSNICGKYPPVNQACSSQGNSCVGSTCYLPDPFAGLQNPFTDGRCPIGAPGLPVINGASYAGANYSNAQKTLTLNAAGCYQSTLVPSNQKLKFTVTNTANPNGYWFQSFSFGGGGGSAGLSLAPNPSSGKVELHILKFAGEPALPTLCTDEIKINGNNDLNISNTYLPSQFKIVYWGTCHLIFLGNSDAALALYAPNAKVTVKGNSDYYGAIFAKELDFSDLGGTILYDESMGGKTLNDMGLQLKNLEETYR